MQGLFSIKDINTAEQIEISASSTRVEDAPISLNLLSTQANNASEVIGKITTEGIQVLVSNGQFSLWHIIESILDQYGPAKLWFTTWALSETTARNLCNWLENGKLKSIYGILDYRSKNNHEAAYFLADMNFTKIKTARCHAKVTVLKGKNFNISIMGSSNLTENPRIEVNVLLDNEEIAQKHTSWIMDLINTGHDINQ